MNDHERTEESRLVARAKEGDMGAFEELVKKYQQSIYYLCRRMAGTHQAADDLSQETFIKAYFSLPRFKVGMNLYSWLRKIAVNNALNYLKLRRREELLEEGKNVTSSAAEYSRKEQPQNEARRSELEERFSQAIEALPSKLKAVFVLRFYEDLSYQEISRILHLRSGTVMSRLNRARAKLKTLMRPYL